ncbi:MAG TPA: hypothetical protein VGE09_08435 [Pseudoxanthomonas sp.]
MTIKLNAISTAPYPQDKPPVWVSLILILIAALGAWGFALAIAYVVIGL